MILKGRAHRLSVNDDTNTDYIISGKFKFHIQDPKELAKHIFEDIEKNFFSRIKKGDFIVAGENFGCGSSREQAPQALNAAGIGVVVAKSFARIFYRNAFNLGLPLIECDTDGISENDSLEIDLEAGVLIDKTKGTKIYTKFIPPVMRKLLNDGGVIKHFKKHGGFGF